MRISAQPSTSSVRTIANGRPAPIKSFRAAALKRKNSARDAHICLFSNDYAIVDPEIRKAVGVWTSPQKSKKPEQAPASPTMTLRPFEFADSHNLVLVSPQVDPYPAAPVPAVENDFEEGLENYRQGGYHPARVGETYHNGRYTVLRKLGWGNSSTVWLVRDASSGREHAMKVQRSAPEYMEAAYDETKFLSELARGDPNDERHCVRLIDSFEHEGPNGTHLCMVLEKLGDNLVGLSRRFDFKGVPLPIVRDLTRQMLTSMDYFHRERQLIHTDFKPENVTLTVPLADRDPSTDLTAPWTCKVVDFGNACKTFKQYTHHIQTREYRCPEVLLGQKYGTPADMWSMACVVFELATGDMMFMPRDGPDGAWSREEDHLAQMSELLGPIPERIWKFGMFSRDLFTPEGRLRHIDRLRPWPLVDVLQSKYGMCAEEAEALASFLLPMLAWSPEDRASAQEMLDHPWLVGSALNGQKLPSAAATL